MKMKNTLAISGIALTLAATLAGCSTATTAPSSSSAPASSATSTAAASSGTAVVLPVDTNPIVNNLTNQDLQVVSAGVEDLIDPVSGAAINDRLMLTLKNNGSTTLSNFEVFYQMSDVTTGATESYYQKLDGFSLAAGAQDYVYFDNLTDPNHYPENQFSLYRSSQNQVDFKISVSSDGAATATATATKSVGTGEKVD